MKMKKEMNEIINPFANKGRMVTGSNFVGRFKGLKTVANTVTDLPMGVLKGSIIGTSMILCFT
jgi:hypothetical protein